MHGWKKTLRLCECAALTHMLVIQLIWQEVFKLCQSQFVQDHSVMVTRLYLGVTILAITAITVAHAGIYLSILELTQIVLTCVASSEVVTSFFFFCRHQYSLSERLSECHMEHHCRAGAICRPPLPRKLCGNQAQRPAYGRWGGTIQLPI